MHTRIGCRCCATLAVHSGRWTAQQGSTLLARPEKKAEEGTASEEGTTTIQLICSMCGLFVAAFLRIT